MWSPVLGRAGNPPLHLLAQNPLQSEACLHGSSRHGNIVTRGLSLRRLTLFTWTVWLQVSNLLNRSWTSSTWWTTGSLWSLVRTLSQPLILAWVHREVGNPSNHSIVELWLEGFLLCYCGTIPVTEAPPPFRGVNGLLDSNQSAPSTLQHTDSVCAGPCIDSPISIIKWWLLGAAHSTIHTQPGSTDCAG